MLGRYDHPSVHRKRNPIEEKKTKKVDGSSDQQSGEVQGEESLTYNDRRLAQDYVRGLPRVVWERTTVEPGGGSFREVKDCEGDESDKNRC
jgi:hypothetical protein